MLNCYKSKKMRKHNEANAYNPHIKQHNIQLRKHQLVCGPTGAGKTNYIMNLISQLKDTFAHIFVYTKNTSEPLYECLKENLKDTCTLELITKVPNLNDQKIWGEALLIFDDWIAEGKSIHTTLTEYAIMARKKKMTCIFLAQSFYAVPKVIRLNVSYLVLLAMADKRNLNMIMATMAVHIDPMIIKKVIANATKHTLNVCLIDLYNRDLNKIMRRNFNDYYILVDKENEELDTIQLYGGSGIVN